MEYWTPKTDLARCEMDLYITKQFHTVQNGREGLWSSIQRRDNETSTVGSCVRTSKTARTILKTKTASTKVPEIELRSPGVMRDDLGKVN